MQRNPPSRWPHPALGFAVHAVMAVVCLYHQPSLLTFGLAYFALGAGWMLGRLLLVRSA